VPCPTLSQNRFIRSTQGEIRNVLDPVFILGLPIGGRENCDFLLDMVLSLIETARINLWLRLRLIPSRKRFIRSTSRRGGIRHVLAHRRATEMQLSSEPSLYRQ
jgi:hypothetical protein